MSLTKTDIENIEYYRRLLETAATVGRLGTQSENHMEHKLFGSILETIFKVNDGLKELIDNATKESETK